MQQRDERANERIYESWKEDWVNWEDDCIGRRT